MPAGRRREPSRRPTTTPPRRAGSAKPKFPGGHSVSITPRSCATTSAGSTPANAAASKPSSVLGVGSSALGGLRRGRRDGRRGGGPRQPAGVGVGRLPAVVQIECLRAALGDLLEQIRLLRLGAGHSVVDIARIHRSRLWRVGRFHGPVLRLLGERLGRVHVRFGELALRLAHRDHLLQVLQLQVARLQPILRAGDLVIDLRDLILARVLLLPQVLLRQGPLELRLGDGPFAAGDFQTRAGVGLGLLIAAHEAGHLALARMMGMRVETFSLGFGPRIWGFRRGETDYRLSALPLGGYCKIAGFTPDDPAAQDPSDPGSYMNKPAWRRFLVIAAGPGVNYLVAFLIIAALYASHGFLDLTTTRVEVIPGGPAAAAGLQTGDQVVAVDGVAVESFDDLRRELQKPGAAAQRRVEVLRDGARQAFTVRPQNGTISVKLDRVMVRLPL